MKKVLKIAVLMQLLLLYCFAIYPHQKENIRLTDGDTKINFHNSKSIASFDSSKLYSNSSVQTEFSSNYSINLSSDFSKYPVKDLFFGNTNCEQIHFNLVLKFLFKSLNNNIRFKQTDIIFPFHYFW